MKLLTNSPNFTLIVPGPCNARCSFCYWQQEEASPQWLQRAARAISSLPPEFKTVSISGGEPTLNPLFTAFSHRSVLALIGLREWERVVLNTNGAYLEQHMDRLSGIVDHINISRHSPNDIENDRVFGVRMPTSTELKALCRQADHLGIDVTLNCIVPGPVRPDDARYFIEYAKTVGASAVCFRKIAGDLDPSAHELAFDAWATVSESSCPVCRSVTKRIRGMRVTFKSSAIDPSREGEGIYEAVLHPSGLLSPDWSGGRQLDSSAISRAVPAESHDVSCGPSGSTSRC